MFKFRTWKTVIEIEELNIEIRVRKIKSRLGQSCKNKKHTVHIPFNIHFLVLDRLKNHWRDHFHKTEIHWKLFFH